MFVIAALAGALTSAYRYLALHPHPFEAMDHRAARLGKAHGISIAYGDPAKFFVPPYGPQDAVPAELTMTQALPENLSSAFDGIELALGQYPPGFVAGLVRAIFIAGEIRVQAEHSGGFTGPVWFVLSASDVVSAESVRLNALEGVHHELSSFVFHRAEATATWAGFSPQGWTFAVDNAAALANGGGLQPAPDTGFLSAYGATNAENDFNTYAEKIFGGAEELVELACQHALVRKKLLFVLQTYVAIDARMAGVFHALGVDRARACE
jgi:hypothetical protein